ncbi:hypothetical protein BH23GEM5_BH23GEM5_00040 [soil metagenome]
MLAELARASELPRTLAPRLSIPVEFRACTLSTPPEGTIPQATCEAPSDPILPSRRILDLAARASASVHTQVDPEALHTAALIDLVWGGASGASLERSISYLQTASRLSERPGPVLADLAAAYLVRAEANQTPRDLLEAIEAAEQALEREPRNGTARFNLALALDRLGLEGQMTEVWQQYLTVDSTSRWAEEARLRLRAAASVRPPPAPSANAPPAELAAYAARAPQEAQFLGWDHLLGAWGSAILQGNTPQAERLLTQVTILGGTLEQRGGDATLADAVRAIQANANNESELRRVARGHRDYTAGRLAYAAGDYDIAGRWFKTVLSTKPRSAPLERWTRMHFGATLVYAGQMEQSSSVFQDLVAKVDTLRHSSLAGRVRWAMGTAFLRQGSYPHAMDWYSQAARMFERAREPEHLGGIQYLIADTEFLLGDAAGAYESVHRALQTLAPYRGSVWLSGLMQQAAQNAAGEGLTRAALRLQNEQIAVASQTGRPIYLAEAHLARARLLTRETTKTSPAEDLRAGRAIIEQMDSGAARSWFEVALRMSEALRLAQVDPRRAVLAFDSVIAFFQPRNEVLFLQGLTGRAEARLALGDIEGTKSDLGRAIAILNEQRNRVKRASLQAAFTERVRQTFDRIVMLHVAAGESNKALEYLEFGRTSMAPIRVGDYPGSSSRSRGAPGQVVVDYALIGDTLLSWTVTDSAMHLRRLTVSSSRLLHVIERVRSALELNAEESAMQDDLAELYDVLIRPAESQLTRPNMPIAVVADGEIASIPFGALYDRRRGRYLVELHPLRFASSLQDAKRRMESSLPRSPLVLLVADPAFDEKKHTGLGRLPHALAEVNAISQGYQRTEILLGHQAQPATLETALRRADILHFAGHAVFDDSRPERSFLLLASAPGSRDSGNLRAAELERLNLRHVKLVVLSACQTAGGKRGRMGGFAGFTSALLGAGAHGVIGSLWKVDDELTGVLMSEFHRAYRTSRDGPAALRTAQLRMLDSSDAAVRSPAAWAGFRYAGN